jgi:hypothetical protein
VDEDNYSEDEGDDEYEAAPSARRREGNHASRHAAQQSWWSESALHNLSSRRSEFNMHMIDWRSKSTLKNLPPPPAASGVAAISPSKAPATVIPRVRLTSAGSEQQSVDVPRRSVSVKVANSGDAELNAVIAVFLAKSNSGVVRSGSSESPPPLLRESDSDTDSEEEKPRVKSQKELSLDLGSRSSSLRVPW